MLSPRCRLSTMRKPASPIGERVMLYRHSPLSSGKTRGMLHQIWKASAGLAVLMLTLGARAGAQLAQDHPGQYSQADIDAGARVYNGECAQCHGANGDQ